MIPKINGSRKKGESVLTLCNPITIQSEFEEYAVKAFEERLSEKGVALKKAENAYLVIKRKEVLSKEAYILSIKEGNILIEASHEAGVIWALTTLWKKIKDNGSILAETICDEPKTAHRGLMLDTARHFFPVKEVKRIIDAISLAKMNVLHWHLADDQGWRIESKHYPMLHKCSEAYYTQEEIREVVAFAKERGVEIIPEIDMPGHTRGILAAYPQYSCSGKEVKLAKYGGIYKRILCAGAEKTYDFLENLLEEICVLFPSKRFHIGGDEAPKEEWKSCPVCTAKMKEENLTSYEDLQGYFSVRVSEILKKYGKQVILWNDSLQSKVLPENMQMQYWSVSYNKASSDYIAEGKEWIYSDMFEFYLDYPHAMTSVKKMYDNKIDFGSCLYDTGNKPCGYEACVWTEHIRTEEELEKHIFPRIYVLAELAWHGASEYEEFEKRLQEEMQSLNKNGISVTPYEEWNPTGEKRQMEIRSYMGNLNAGLANADQEEVVDPSDTGEEFKQKFMQRFFS